MSEIYGGITDNTLVSIVFKFAASTNGGSGSLLLNNDYIIFDDTGVVIDARLLNKIYLHRTCYDVNQKSWDWDLPKVTSMNYTFYNTKLTEWHVELPKVTSMEGTFYNTKLTEWNISLDILTTANNTFRHCSITEWNINLPKLTSGRDFIRDTPIVSFTGNLDSLSDGYDFVWNCPKLTTFNSALPKLNSGVDMFGGTILNKESAIRVLETIPTYTSGSHGLMIGIHIDHKYDPDV